MALECRDLDPKDYEKGIINLLGELTTIDQSKISPQHFSNYVNTLNSNDNHFTKVIEHHNTIVATATLLVEPKLIHNLSYVGHIEDVVVDSRYRGSGLGRKIVENLVEMAKTRGCYKVILDCDSNNAPFYQKCGFRKKGVEMAQYFS